MAKVLVVGKARCLVRMTENTAEGFRQAGCEVEPFAVNGDNRVHAFYYKVRGTMIGGRAAAVAEGLGSTLKRFQPDLVVFVLGAWLTAEPYQIVAEVCPRAVRAAWVGDLFTPQQATFANDMDWIFCTDSHFMKLVRDYGFTVPTRYLPLAMDPHRFFPMDVPRTHRMVYVAKNSPGRAAFVSQIDRPLALYGERWRRLKNSHHEIHPQHVPLERLPGIYASACAVLNIKNELNVMHGINQRSFEPYGCKTPVLNDDLADIGLCMEPGREILVYRSVEELHELYDRLMNDPPFARAIGEAGYQRVMAEHTYAHRARSMLRQVGLE